MNAENLSRRIARAALGKSDPSALAGKLLEIKGGSSVSENAPEDEQIWSAVILKQLPPRPQTEPKPDAAPAAPLAASKPVANPKKTDGK